MGDPGSFDSKLFDALASASWKTFVGNPFASCGHKFEIDSLRREVADLRAQLEVTTAELAVARQSADIFLRQLDPAAWKRMHEVARADAIAKDRAQVRAQAGEPSLGGAWRIGVVERPRWFHETTPTD